MKKDCKNQNLSLALTLVMGLSFFLESAHAAKNLTTSNYITTSGAITEFQFHSCSGGGGRCLSIRAARAQGSSLRHLIFFRNPKVAFRKNPGAASVQSKDKYVDGYLDLDLNRVVLRGPAKGKIEHIYDMSSLKRLAL